MEKQLVMPFSLDFSVSSQQALAEEQKVRRAGAAHRQVAGLPVDFDAQVGGEVVLLRAAGLRQAEPQLHLHREVALLRRPSEHTRAAQKKVDQRRHPQKKRATPVANNPPGADGLTWSC